MHACHLTYRYGSAAMPQQSPRKCIFLLHCSGERKYRWQGPQEGPSQWKRKSSQSLVGEMPCSKQGHVSAHIKMFLHCESHQQVLVPRCSCLPQVLHDVALHLSHMSLGIVVANISPLALNFISSSSTLSARGPLLSPLFFCCFHLCTALPPSQWFNLCSHVQH